MTASTFLLRSAATKVLVLCDCRPQSTLHYGLSYHIFLVMDALNIRMEESAEYSLTEVIWKDYVTPSDWCLICSFRENGFDEGVQRDHLNLLLSISCRIVEV